MSYGTHAVTIDGHNITRDATGANAFLLYAADGPCYVDRVEFQPLGDNSATAARLFVSDGNVNLLVGEVTLPATSSTDETAAVAKTALAADLYLEQGQRLTVTVGVAVSDGFTAVAYVGQNFSDFNV